MSKNSDNFISEIYQTTDRMFSFQKVGRYYRLYDRDSDYAFLKEFASFGAMQDYMNEVRNGNAKEKVRGI